MSTFPEADLVLPDCDCTVFGGTGDLAHRKLISGPAPPRTRRSAVGGDPHRIRDNPTLFMRRDEVEAAWAWVEPILQRWEQRGDAPTTYPASTSGPTAAAELIEQDGRSWQEDTR